MKLPIGGFNPMGKEHVTEKLIELKNLEAENIIANILDKYTLADTVDVTLRKMRDRFRTMERWR